MRAGQRERRRRADAQHKGTTDREHSVLTDESFVLKFASYQK